MIKTRIYFITWYSVIQFGIFSDISLNTTKIKTFCKTHNEKTNKKRKFFKTCQLQALENAPFKKISLAGNLQIDSIFEIFE